MFQTINTVTTNVRCINTLGKRQELAQQWEKDNVHVAMLSEIQRNMGGMEKAGPWGKYVCFFSTGIDFKKREANEERRDLKATERRRTARNKKGKLEPKAMAKAKPKVKEGEEAGKGKEKGKGKGKGKAPTRKESDYEHAGVGIAIHRNMLKHVEEVREVSGRAIVLKLKAAAGEIVSISVPPDSRIQGCR